MQKYLYLCKKNKTMIFYFSGTGNTRWIAQQLAEATGEQLVNIADEMLEIADEMLDDNREHADARFYKEYSLADGERLGFCFPTHGWQPPKIVRSFIRRASFQHISYVYAVTTCGDSVGDAMSILNKELSLKGFQAETLFSVIMPESYVCLPFMYTDNEEREKEKIANARQQIKHIIDTIKGRKRGVIELERGAVPLLYSYVIGNYFNKCMITDDKFVVDADICTQCGRCEKVCPVHNMKGTPPVWQHNKQCTCCLACYHHCPVHAINYGSITRKRGQYYFRDK